MVEIEKSKVRNKKCSEETEQRHDTQLVIIAYIIFVMLCYVKVIKPLGVYHGHYLLVVIFTFTCAIVVYCRLVVSSITVRGEVSYGQLHLIKFVDDLWQIGGFFLMFHHSDRLDITKYCVDIINTQKSDLVCAHGVCLTQIRLESQII